MGKINLVNKLELERYDWSSISEKAGKIPEILEELFSAECIPEGAYWTYENRVVDEGFDGAEYLIPILIMSLLDQNTIEIRGTILELLFLTLIDIFNDDEYPPNVEICDPNFILRCKKKAREGMGILYYELVNGDRDAAFEILELIEEDKERLNYYVKKLKIQK